MATQTLAPPARWGDRLRGGLGVFALTVFLLVVLYPLVWMLGTSFKSPTEITSNLSVLPKEWTVNNFVDGWRGPVSGVNFGRFFLNSAIIAVSVVVANVFSCLVTAFAFARLRFPGRRLYFSLMIVTLLLPHHVLIIPQFILFRQFGWVDTPLPLIVPKLLATEAFFIFLMVQFMRGIPRELDEAAKMDGCSPYRIFWHVMVPLARPALVTTAIFSFIWTWNDFLTQLIYLNEPTGYTVPIALRLFMDSEGQTSLGPMFAMSVVSLAPVFLFFISFQKLLVEGINTSGLKG